MNELGPKRVKSLEDTDRLPPQVRECVHEFGLPIVTVCLKHGINSPAKIRELVREIWAGARQTGQRNDTRGTLDWLLMQAGAAISARTLYRTLADNNLAVVSTELTKRMLAASIAEVSGHNILCTKEEKHRRRFRAAIRAAIKEQGVAE